jgi:hypothetical protein
MGQGKGSGGRAGSIRVCAVLKVLEGPARIGAACTRFGIALSRSHVDKREEATERGYPKAIGVNPEHHLAFTWTPDLELVVVVHL